MSSAQPTSTSTFFGEPTPTFLRDPKTMVLGPVPSKEYPSTSMDCDPFEISHKKEGDITRSNLHEIWSWYHDFFDSTDPDHCFVELKVKPFFEWQLTNCNGDNYINLKLKFEIQDFSKNLADFEIKLLKYKNMCKNLFIQIPEIDHDSLRLIFLHNPDRSDDLSHDLSDDLCFSETRILVRYDIVRSDGTSEECVLDLMTVEYDQFPIISNIKIIGHPSQIVPSIIHSSQQKNPLKSEISIGLNCIHADSSFEYTMPGIFSHLPKTVRVNPCISVSDITDFFLNSNSNSNSECDMGIIRTVLIRLCFKTTEGKIDVYKCFQQDISVQIDHPSPELVIGYMYKSESSSSYIILVMVKTVNDVGSTTEVLFYIHIDYDQDESSSKFQVIRSIGKPDEKGNLHLPDGYSEWF